MIISIPWVLFILVGSFIIYRKGYSDGIDKGYFQGKLDMTVKMEKIKSCDYFIEKTIREKYEELSNSN